MKRRIERVTRAVRETLASEGGRRVVRTTVLLLGCTVVSQLCSLGVVLLMARQLGPAGLGRFLFALTVQGYLALVSGAGAGQVLVREVAADRQRTDEYVTAYLVLVGGTTLVVTAAAFVVLWLGWPGAEEGALLAWVLAGNVAASMSLLPLYDVQHKQARAGLIGAAVDLLTLGGFAAAVSAGALTLPVAGILMAVKWSSILATQAITYRLSLGRVTWQFRGPRLAILALSGVQLLVSSLLLVVPLNGGVIFMRLFRSAPEVAAIGIASQVMLVYLTLCLQIFRVAQPHVMGPGGLDHASVRRTVSAVGASLLSVCCAVLAGATVLLHVVLPGSYAEALQTTALMLVGGSFVALGQLAGLYLHRARRERHVVLAHFVGCLLFLVTAGLVTDSWGSRGAAGCTLMAGGVIAGLQLASALTGLEVAPETKDGQVLDEGVGG